MPPIWILSTQAERGDGGHCSSAGEDGGTVGAAWKELNEIFGNLDPRPKLWHLKGGGRVFCHRGRSHHLETTTFLLEGKHHLLQRLLGEWCLPSHSVFTRPLLWRGRVYKLIFCPPTIRSTCGTLWPKNGSQHHISPRLRCFNRKITNKLCTTCITRHAPILVHIFSILLLPHEIVAILTISIPSRPH